MKYIIVAKYYGSIQKRIAQIKTWWVESDGLEVAPLIRQINGIALED